MELIVGIIELFFLLGASLGISFVFIKSDITNDPFVSFILRMTLGLGMISYLTLLLASLHFLNLWIFLAVLLTGNGLLLKNRRLLPHIQITLKISPLNIMLLAFLAINFFYSLFPPSFYDSMLYHLAIPQYYLQHGGIVPWNCNFNSNLFLNGEMLYLFSLLGGTVHIPRLLSFFAGAGILVLMFIWSKNNSNSKYPLLPLVFFYTVPEIGFLTSSSKTDILGMLFLFSGFYTYFLFEQNPSKKRNTFLCGIFWGMAISTKYIFAFYFLAFLFSIFLFSAFPFRKKLVSCILISLLVFLCLLPWLVKNTLISGNPVYPYLNSIFKSKSWSSEQGGNFSNALKRGQGYHISDYLNFPLELFIKPYKYGVTAVWGILFLLLLPFLFFSDRSSVNRFLIFSSILAFFILSLFVRVPRYFLSSLLLLSLPLGSGVGKIMGKKELNKKIFIAVLISVLSIHLILQINLQETFSQGIRYVKLKIRGRPEGETFKYLNIVPYYRAAEFINQKLTRDDRIMFLGEERTFYFKKKFIACSFADYHPLIEMLKVNPEFTEFRQGLKRKGVTHILYSEKGLQRMGRLSKLYRLTQIQTATLKQHLSHFSIIYRDYQYIVYQIN